MGIQMDNEIMKMINLFDKDKKVYSEDGIKDFGMDAALNWNKTAENIEGEKLNKISKAIQSYADEGFSSSEIKELLLSDGHGEYDIDSVMNRLEVISNETPKLSFKYEHIARKIEKLSETLTPDDFINTITANDNPEFGILRLSNNQKMDLESILRHIHLRKESGNMATQDLYKEMHAIIKPSIDEELFRTKLQAKLGLKNTKISSTNKKTIVCISNENEKYLVDVEDMTCGCDRFQNGHFQHFGIPCEHIVIACGDQ